MLKLLCKLPYTQIKPEEQKGVVKTHILVQAAFI